MAVELRPARTDERERLDTEVDSVPSEQLAGNLRDIRRVNRYFGGTRAVLHVLEPELARLSASSNDVLSILDLATGSADIPLALVQHAHRKNQRVHVLATDAQAPVLALARNAAMPGSIELAEADARHLPYPNDAFDIATLSLALHHFPPHEAMLVLAEMRRVTRHLMLVNDLERCYAGLAGAWLAGHALTRNPLTRHDAPLSVRRAYTRAEAVELAHAAGWHSVAVRGAFAFRYVLTGRP